MESFGTYDPTSDAVIKGTVTTDGSTYDIFRNIRVYDWYNLYQYYSIRRDQRTSGSVNTAAHFDAWAALGWRMGTHDFQIVATEGYYSNGTADITVS